MFATSAEIGELVLRMEGEFLETPALKLTLATAQRRFGVDATTCEAVLHALVEAEVLCKTDDGAYVRFFPRLVIGSQRGRCRAAHAA